MGVREDTARGHCLSFYDKLNFLFRTRQTKARDSCFFFFLSTVYVECKFLSLGSSKDDYRYRYASDFEDFKKIILMKRL